ncbi:hypothetical protein OEZ49_17980 [Ruegeria sp. WL0004]|uniref:Uncharacterized protein n=1 Tax=Ruegeria marisflavi TaxID=2984152 RepID=A0ABT2WWM1_9RHOB|nr:hypothetical protein [Ruegeria sp. WL0004]MCU9839667.1 hypothetical protein [Ruegeria sp. WL0004]
MTNTNHETSDDYAAVVANLTDDLRVITCKGGIQWILQKRDKGSAERPWVAKGYFRTRKALMRVGAGLGAPTDKLEALPATFIPTN